MASVGSIDPKCASGQTRGARPPKPGCTLADPGWYNRPGCCTAARMALIQAALLENDILADDQAMGSHFLQPGENAADVFVGIDEGDDDG
jgi:hypothetical protein